MRNFCAVVGCGNRANREKTKSFYRLSAIVTGKGEALRELTERRRRAWLIAINRKDIRESNLKYTRVYSDHFISGKPSDVNESGLGSHPKYGLLARLPVRSTGSGVSDVCLGLCAIEVA